MRTKPRSAVFDREVELYPAILSLFRRLPYALAEVPYFGKRVDLVFSTASFRHVYAVETKIEDWRIALKQAALNQLFAQWSYVALPATIVRRLRRADRQLFAEYEVGLIGVAQEADIEITAVRSSYFALADHRRVKRVLRSACASKSPRALGEIANAITNGSRTLELLQTGASEGKRTFQASA